MAKEQVKTKKISKNEQTGSIEIKPVQKEIQEVVPEVQDLEKNDYQNHPKFSKFNQVGGL